MLQAAQPGANALDVPMLDAMAVAPASTLFEGPRSEETFGGARGLARGPAFTPAEVARIREIIKAHMVGVARTISLEAAADLEGAELEQFHTLDSYDHKRMLSKAGRILPDAAVQEMKAMSFFDYVREAFGDFYLADEEEVGHEQITFRIVRPGQPEDVGSLHRDAWFWEHHGTRLPAGIQRAKVWVPIAVKGELNGLRLAPGSHRIEAPYHVGNSSRGVEFVPEFDVAQIGLCQYGGDVGEPILFNYRMLHVGSFNRATSSRVSIETTIMFRPN